MLFITITMIIIVVQTHQLFQCFRYYSFTYWVCIHLYMSNVLPSAQAYEHWPMCAL